MKEQIYNKREYLPDRKNPIVTKTDKTIWKTPLSKRTRPLSTNPLFLSNFFMSPIFIQISKTRNTSNFRWGGGGGGGRKQCYIYSKFVITKWMIVLLVTETFQLLESGQVYSTATYAIFFEIETTAISVILFPFLSSSCFIYAKTWSNPKLKDLIIELATPENDPKRW